MEDDKKDVVVETSEPEKEEVKSNPKSENSNNVNLESDSYFDGTLLQLIGTKILCFIVTIFSLGILYPLAKCIEYKWEIKHTVINGKRLTFDGKWYQLLGNWIKWLLLTIITLGIYSFWVIISFNKWILKHTHYEGTVEGEENKSCFDGTALQLFGTNILGFLITLFSFGLLTPTYLCLIYNWKIKHMVIDGDRMEFSGSSLKLLGLWLKWVLLTIVTLGIYSFWIPISLLKWEKKHTNKQGLKKAFSPAKALIIPILVMILGMAVFVSKIVIADNAILKVNESVIKFEEAEENARKDKTKKKDKNETDTDSKSKLSDIFASAKDQTDDKENNSPKSDTKLLTTGKKEFVNNLAWSRWNDVWVCVNTKGKIVFKLEPEIKDVFDFENPNYTLVKRNNGDRLYIDNKGNVLFDDAKLSKEYDNIVTEDPKAGYLVVSKEIDTYKLKETQYGLIDMKGNWVIPLSAENGELAGLKSGWSQGILKARERFYIVKNAQYIPCTANEYLLYEDDNYFYTVDVWLGYFVRKVKKDGSDDQKIITGVKEIGGYSKEDNLVFIRTNDKKAFYNLSGEQVFTISDIDIVNKPIFSKGYAIVEFKNNGGTHYWSIIDKQCKFQFEPIKCEGNVGFETLGEGRFFVRMNGKGYVCDKDGKKLFGADKGLSSYKNGVSIKDDTYVDVNGNPIEVVLPKDLN